VVLAVGLSLASCSNEKGSASAAIASAQSAYAAIKDNAEKIAPEQAKSIEDAIAAAQASLDKGDAKGALAAAQSVTAQVKQLADALPAKTQELTNQWQALAPLPDVMKAVQSRVDILSKSAHLPGGMDKAALESVKSGIAGAQKTWEAASSAFSSGNLAEAVSKGMDAKHAAASALTTLKMPVPPAMQ
jgi:uncharacterized protein YoxC